MFFFQGLIKDANSRESRVSLRMQTVENKAKEIEKQRDCKEKKRRSRGAGGIRAAKHMTAEKEKVEVERPRSKKAEKQRSRKSKKTEKHEKQKSKKA
jgi:hypothetical protein